MSTWNQQDLSLVRLSRRNGTSSGKSQKTANKLRKHNLLWPLNTLAIIWLLIIFIQLRFILVQLNHTKRLIKLARAIFESHWFLLLRNWAKKGEETNNDHSQKCYEIAYCPPNKTSFTTYQTLYYYLESRKWIGPLNDENKLKIDENNNKNWKVWNIFEKVQYHKL